MSFEDISLVLVEPSDLVSKPQLEMNKVFITAAVSLYLEQHAYQLTESTKDKESAVIHRTADLSRI
ncbi:hypothetical protein BOTNAR_0467g00020 [Botryotinia narcissicola]|uniref:Uncharacterized protein n=1 Tax=Botryotinia narcissicola TaxID=278944 RepID=A0A4Z1HJ12_9HELO|nr:hypothetical protein BOTNAR_0467g00020 [Botryotinia narcissicola]